MPKYYSIRSTIATTKYDKAKEGRTPSPTLTVVISGPTDNNASLDATATTAFLNSSETEEDRSKDVSHQESVNSCNTEQRRKEFANKKSRFVCTGNV